MKRKNKSKCNSSKKVLPWRIKKNQWTDTLFDSKLLENPSLMTNAELARAFEEHLEYRKASGKYHWEEDPIKENAESEPPFSPHVLSNFIMETIARLKIGGDLAMGRFKNHV